MNKIDYSSIPMRMRGGLQRYFEHGIRPGSFLTAIIENDLIAAVQNADYENVGLLPIYASFMASQAPRGSWGSVIDRMNWQERHNDKRKKEGK